jgi:predicted GNAT family acetyltransferase
MQEPLGIARAQIREIWPPERWQRERQGYWSVVRRWVEERLRRTSRGERHPVYDFLFEYYSFRPSQLMRWSPGWGVLLQSASWEDVGWKGFQATATGIVLPAAAFPQQRLDYLRWAVEYLSTVSTREPSYSCLGLHEWAMVYRQAEIRHPYVPLRLRRCEIDAVVECHCLQCTHYDAYRFFTPAARPRNRWPLSRLTTIAQDQPGCLHVNMDLYRFAYKIAPFCPSQLLAAAFEVARQAREIDMRASPYDLRDYGLTPICIETASGRAEYVEAQRRIYELAQPLRRQLCTLYRQLLEQRCHETL